MRNSEFPWSWTFVHFTIDSTQVHRSSCPASFPQALKAKTDYGETHPRGNTVELSQSPHNPTSRGAIFKQQALHSLQTPLVWGQWPYREKFYLYADWGTWPSVTPPLLFLSRANTEKQGEDQIGVFSIVKNNTPHSTDSVFFEHSDCSRYVTTRHGHLSLCSQKSSVPLNLAQCKTPGNRGLCPDTLT